MNPLPEERLLKFIRGRSARPASEPAAVQASASAVADTTTSPLQARWLALRWHALVVWVLGAILVLEVGCLIVQALRPLPPVPVSIASVPAHEPAAPPPPAPEIPLLAASVSRPLFTASPSSSGAIGVGGSGSPSQPVSSSAKELAARLTLMGIVSGNPPQAIIEDAQTKKTYFVTAGQAVVEGAVLEQVLDNRVVLDLMGEKIELSL